MIEVSNNEIELLQRRDKLVSYLLLGFLVLYTVVTILVTAITINMHQNNIIDNQRDTIIYLTSELISKDSK